MNWEQMRRQYYRTDGTFRDVYATGMDLLAWMHFFDLMREQTLTFHTSEDGVAEETAAINVAQVERQWELREYVPAARVQLPGLRAYVMLGGAVGWFLYDASVSRFFRFLGAKLREARRKKTRAGS